MPRRRKLVDELRRVRPDLDEPQAAIVSGWVLVDGSVVTNPASMVRAGASIRVRGPQALRGTRKLTEALRRLDVPVAGKVAVDVGAAAGGFTRALLDAGARTVYAVDAGHGQLLASLRQDARVVDLEATNLADLTADLVPEPVELVALDLSYLSLARAVTQLEGLAFAPGADLIGLVKPMFELRLASAPTDLPSLDAATARAVRGIEDGGWRVVGTAPSDVGGARGAIEGFVHARRR